MRHVLSGENSIVEICLDIVSRFGRKLDFAGLEREVILGREVVFGSGHWDDLIFVGVARRGGKVAPAEFLYRPDVRVLCFPVVAPALPSYPGGQRGKIRFFFSDVFSADGESQTGGNSFFILPGEKDDIVIVQSDNSSGICHTDFLLRFDPRGSTYTSCGAEIF